MLAKKFLATGVVSCIIASLLLQYGEAKQQQKEKRKQKYVCMGAVNSALEHIPFLSLRFAMAVKHAREVLVLLKDDVNGCFLTDEDKSIFLDAKIMHVVEPIKIFLMVAREQRVAAIPLFEQLFEGEMKALGMSGKNKKASYLAAFCKGPDRQAYDFFKKNILTQDELQQLSEEITLVFGAILHDLTEPARKVYDDAVEAVRKISSDKTIKPLEPLLQ